MSLVLFEPCAARRIKKRRTGSRRARSDERHDLSPTPHALFSPHRAILTLPFPSSNFHCINNPFTVDDMEGTSLPEALSGEAKAALKDVTAKASKVADDVKTAVSKAVDRIKEHLEGYQLGKGWFGREQPLLTIPPLSSFVLGWTALVGGAAGFSLREFLL